MACRQNAGAVPQSDFADYVQMNPQRRLQEPQRASSFIR